MNKNPFSTTDEELKVTLAWLLHLGLRYQDILSIKKSPSWKVDVIVTLTNKQVLNIELHNDKQYDKYHQYGFEGCTFNEDKFCVKPPKTHWSKADIWLFYTLNNNHLSHMQGYWFVRDKFKAIEAISHYIPPRHSKRPDGTYDSWYTDCHMVNADRLAPYAITKPYDLFN